MSIKEIRYSPGLHGRCRSCLKEDADHEEIDSENNSAFVCHECAEKHMEWEKVKCAIVMRPSEERSGMRLVRSLHSTAGR